MKGHVDTIEVLLGVVCTSEQMYSSPFGSTNNISAGSGPGVQPSKVETQVKVSFELLLMK